MLLRRVSEHVKAQNWLAVGIDFVIVVVGVFVGLQVANWNDERKDRVDEVYYLERILEDIDESIANNNSVLEFLKEKSRNAYWVANTLRHGQLDPADQNLFDRRFLDLEDWRTGDFIDSTLQELQSSGRMGIIQSRSFHESLGRFELELESYHRAQTNLSDFLKALTLQMSTHVDRVKTEDFHASLANAETPRLQQNQLHRQRVLLSSFEEMSNNTQLIRIIDQYAEFYYWRRDNVADLQEELHALRAQTLSALEQTR